MVVVVVVVFCVVVVVLVVVVEVVVVVVLMVVTAGAAKFSSGLFGSKDWSTGLTSSSSELKTSGIWQQDPK